LVILAVVGTGGFMYVCRSEPSAMYLALLLGLTVVIFAVKHIADVFKRKEW
jgi:predicted tellurium resistance membrane protein TerC